MSRLALLPLVALLLAGCANHGEAGMFARHEDMEIQTIHAPKVDRCQKFQNTAMFGRCQEFKQQAENYLHGLNTGATVCMEGGFGEDLSDRCKARGEVIDADAHGLLVQLREPHLDSRWKDYDGKELYFENGALIDLYLHDSGFE